MHVVFHLSVNLLNLTKMNIYFGKSYEQKMVVCSIKTELRQSTTKFIDSIIPGNIVQDMLNISLNSSDNYRCIAFIA